MIARSLTMARVLNLTDHCLHVCMSVIPTCQQTLVSPHGNGWRLPNTQLGSDDEDSRIQVLRREVSGSLSCEVIEGRHTGEVSPSVGKRVKSSARAAATKYYKGGELQQQKCRVWKLESQDEGVIRMASSAKAASGLPPGLWWWRPSWAFLGWQTLPSRSPSPRFSLCLHLCVHSSAFIRKLGLDEDPHSWCQRNLVPL